MTRKTELPTRSRHLMIYDSDWDFLETNFGARSGQPIGVGRAIRKIVHKHVEAMRAKQIEAIDEIEARRTAAYGKVMTRMAGGQQDV